MFFSSSCIWMNCFNNNGIENNMKNRKKKICCELQNCCLSDGFLQYSKAHNELNTKKNTEMSAMCIICVLLWFNFQFFCCLLTNHLHAFPVVSEFIIYFCSWNIAVDKEVITNHGDGVCGGLFSIDLCRY